MHDYCRDNTRRNENLLLTFCKVWCRVVEQYVGIVIVIDVDTLSLATAVTSAVASAAARCCSVFGSGAMSAVVPAVAACTAVCGCPYLLIVLHPNGTDPLRLFG
jgi:hypothetical protein